MDNKESWIYETFRYKESTIPYMIHYPEGFVKDKKYPILLFLVGDGSFHKGVEHALWGSHEAVFPHRMAKEQDEAIIIVPAEEDHWIYWGSEIRNEYRQRPVKNEPFDDAVESYCLQGVMELLFKKIEQYGDSKRIYLSGYSRGCMGSWFILAKYPSLFAAAGICVGAGDPKIAPKLKDIPIWVFTGEEDDIVDHNAVKEMYDALVKAGNKKAKFTCYKGYGHGLYEPLMKEKGIISWMLSQHKE